MIPRPDRLLSSPRLQLTLAVVLYLVLAVSLAAHWSMPGDEGGTFDQALGPLDLASEPGPRTPFRALAPRLAGEADYGVADVLAALRSRGMHPPAYLVGFHLWARLGGTEPGWLRLPGLLLGMLSILAIAAVARELAPGSGAAPWAAALLAASLTHLHFSVYLRPYALALPLMIASLWLLLRLREATSPRGEAARWAGFIALSVLGLYTLYHYAFFLAWQFLVLLGWAVLAPKASRSMDLARLAGAGLVVALAYGPWLPALSGHLDLTARGRFYFQGFPASETLLANATNLLRKLVLMDAFPDLTLRTPLAGLALLTALLVARPLLTASSGSRRRDLRLFWLSLPLLPGGIFLADYLRETHTIFLMKTTLALLPLGILALAVGAASLPQRWLGTATLALWLAIFLAGSATRVAAAVATPAWKQRVAETLRMHDRETHVVVVSSQDRRFLYPLMMTLRDAGVARVTLSLARGRELHDVLVSLLRDGGAQRLSLVSFVDEPWSDESRREAITAARLFGWRRERHGIPALISLVPGASSRPREASPAR